MVSVQMKPTKQPKNTSHLRPSEATRSGRPVHLVVPVVRRRRRSANDESVRVMAAVVRGIGAKLSEHREKVTSALLLGSFVALAVRSSEQQREIDDLEARKSALRAANSSMSSAMWAWREELFALAAAPSPPISAARLRYIYGEEEPAPPAPKQPGSDAEEESISIA